MVIVSKILELSSMVFSYMALGAGFAIAPYVVYNFISYIIVKMKLLKFRIKETSNNGI